MPNPNHRFLVALLALCVVRAAHGAICDAGYYLKNGECADCNPGLEPYYCPGDDMRYQCPTTDTDYNQFGYTYLGGGEGNWSLRMASSVQHCMTSMHFRDEYGNIFMLEESFNGKNYWGDSKSWYIAAPGFYLSPYLGTSYKDWYRGVKPCTNAPENAHYTGPGTPDEPRTGGATDANDCPWECNAGYYLNNGECKPCTGATYSDTPGATACTPCPTAIAFADRVTGYWYWSDNGVHDNVKGCNATIAPNDPRGDYMLHCAICNGDYGLYDCPGVCQAYPRNCIGGYYVPYTTDAGAVWGASAAAMKEVVCRPVGVGYWSADGDLDATACPTGLTTAGYGPAADEAADCGHALRFGDNVVHLRSERKTTPSLNVQIGDTVFYGNMSTVQHGNLRINLSGTTYSVYDDNM